MSPSYEILDKLQNSILKYIIITFIKGYMSVGIDLKCVFTDEIAPVERMVTKDFIPVMKGYHSHQRKHQ
jgi:hypothetical protein